MQHNLLVVKQAPLGTVSPQELVWTAVRAHNLVLVHQLNYYPLDKMAWHHRTVDSCLYQGSVPCVHFHPICIGLSDCGAGVLFPLCCVVFGLDLWMEKKYTSVMKFSVVVYLLL